MQRCTLHVLCISLLFQVKLFVCLMCVQNAFRWIFVTFWNSINTFIGKQHESKKKKSDSMWIQCVCVFFIKILWSERRSLSDICRTIPSKNGIPRIMVEWWGNSTLLILDDYYIMHTPNVQTNRQMIYMENVFDYIVCDLEVGSIADNL